MVQALSSTRNQTYEVSPNEVTSGQIVDHNEPDGTLSDELLEEFEEFEEFEVSPALAPEYEVDEIEEMEEYLDEEEEENNDFWDDTSDHENRGWYDSSSVNLDNLRNAIEMGHYALELPSTSDVQNDNRGDNAEVSEYHSLKNTFA